MASIQQEEQIVSRDQEKKIIKKEQTVTKKKPIEKGKVIAFSVFGLIVVVVFTLIALSFKTEEQPNNLENQIPVSEEEKYNSKLEAIGESDKTKYSNNVDLEDAYKESVNNEQNKSTDELQGQLDGLENEEKKPTIEKSETIKPKSYNNRRSSNSLTGKNEGYKNTAPIERKEEKRVISTPTSSGFFTNKSSNSTSSITSISNVLLYASIHTDQIIKDGSRVKMRLTKTVTINNNTFPVNTIIYGIAKIQPNRLKVEINKINQTDVKLEIFDAEDSNNGIYVQTPNLNALIRKEFKKDALDEQDLEKIPFSKTLKNLFAKKAREENIELLNNYKIIIKQKDEN